MRAHGMCEISTADRRVDEMDYRIEGIGTKSWNIGIFDADREYRSCPANSFRLTFSNSAIVKTVNRAPDILNSLLQKLNIGKRFIDTSQEEENRAATPLPG
jgi:hypothetical protein